MDAPRQTGHGKYIAKCVAHEDRIPSLSIRETEDGRILIHCFGGCSIMDVCRALGIEVAQLFEDSGFTPPQRRTMPSQPRRFDWRKMSHDLDFASESHWLRAESIFKVARQCDVSAMNDEDLDQAWRCLGIAFHSRRVSENLGIIAFQIRVNGLADEARQHGDRKVTV